jgi:Major tropism determinant N-terminal domain
VIKMSIIAFASEIALKRGTAVKSLNYTGAAGTLTIDTDNNELRIHDGVTVGGAIANQSAATAVKLKTARNINGVAFDGTADITVSAVDTATPRVAVATLMALTGAANGLATLDATGRVPSSQIPGSVSGSMNYQGSWDASANTPGLIDGTGSKGFYYKVSVAGNTTIDGNNNWTVGDIIAFNGTTWDKFEGGQPDVVSVNGRIGAITLTKADVSLSNVPNVDATDATNITAGTLAASHLPAFTGDATVAAGTSNIVLADTGVVAGTYMKTIFNAKGLATGSAAVTYSDILAPLSGYVLDCGLIP